MVYSCRLEAMDVFDYFHAKAKLFFIIQIDLLYALFVLRTLRMKYYQNLPGLVMVVALCLDCLEVIILASDQAITYLDCPFLVVEKVLVALLIGISFVLSLVRINLCTCRRVDFMQV